MRIYESGNIHVQEAVELCVEHGEAVSLQIPKGLVISDPTDIERDAIMNIGDGLGSSGLCGFMAKLIPDKKDPDDPDFVNLISVPCHGQIIRHQDRYYLVKVVLQSSNCSLAIFCQKLSQEEFYNVVNK